MIMNNALRELIMSACRLHCDYQANTHPFQDYSEIEHLGLYDEAHSVNLPMGNDACNSIVEEDIRDVKYINS